MRALVLATAPIVLGLDGLRSHGTRAALAIAGVAVGIAPVLVIVTMITGVRGAIARDFGQIAPGGFVIARIDPTDVAMAVPMQRPPITLDEVEMLGRLPGVGSASGSIDATVSLAKNGREYHEVEVQGTAVPWPETNAGEFIAGRNFVAAEQERGAPVAVVSAALARRLSSAAEIIGETFQMDGVQFRVVGVYRDVPTLLVDTAAFWVRTPYTTALRALPIESEWLEVRVMPALGRSRAAAEETVVAALRSARRLKPEQKNDFSIMGEEGIESLFNEYAGTLSAAMVLLTSLGLLVGGVGVTGIMTVSIAERTHEIGVRRALGATRRDIAAQFLMEAVTITVAGSVIGLALGAAVTMLMRSFTPIPAELPGWALAFTIAMAAVSGIGLGLYPALKAANLDPAAALRSE